MAIVIDLADPETDIDDLKNITTKLVTDDLRESLTLLAKFGLGEVDTISDEDIKTIIETDQEESATVDEFRDNIQYQREQLVSKDDREARILSALLNIIKYIFSGENREKAVQSQNEGICNGWNITVTIPVEE